MNDDDIKALLKRAQTIAVIGLSPNAERPSHGVGQALKDFGYRVIPINPQYDSVLGETSYPDLASVPDSVDLVDVFRAPEHVPAIVDACIELGLAALWLQEGVVHEPAAQRARDAGIALVMDRCIFKEHRRLMATA